MPRNEYQFYQCSEQGQSMLALQAWAEAATFNRTWFIPPHLSLQGLVCVHVLSSGSRACGFGWGSPQIVAFGCFSPQLNSLNQ